MRWQFLGNSAAYINIKKARFVQKFFLLKTAFYGLDTELEPEQ